MKKELDLKGTIFENAKVIRAVQYVGDGKKTEENLVYSMELELNKIPLIVTMRIGKDFTEITATDKKTGQMLEYIGEQNGKMEIVRAHKFNANQIRKMLETKEK